jgi:hypothetical protein
MSDSDNIYYEPEDYNYRQIPLYRTYRTYGGVEPSEQIEARSSTDDKAIGIALGIDDDDNIEDDGVNAIKYETRPRLTIKDILEETNRIFDSAVKKDGTGPKTRDLILGQMGEGQILNATKWLIANFNAPYADVPNLDPEDDPYDADDITDTIFANDKISDELINGIKSKITGNYDIPSASVIYLYLAILGPIDSYRTRDYIADKSTYEVSVLNDSFKVLDESIPASKNVYGPASKIAKETDISGLDDSAPVLSDSEAIEAAVIASPDNADNEVLTPALAPLAAPAPAVPKPKLKARDRVYDLMVKSVRILGLTVEDIDYALKNKSSDKEGPYAKLKKQFREAIKAELTKIINTNADVNYDFKDIDKNLMTGTETEINKRINSQIDGVLIKDKVPVPDIAKNLMGVPREVKPVGRPPMSSAPAPPAPVTQPSKAALLGKTKTGKTKTTDTEEPPKKILKLDMSKFAKIAEVLNSQYGAKVEAAKVKNIETVAALSEDKQDTKNLVGLMFDNKKPIEEVSSDLAKVIKIPPPPPLNLGQIVSATQAVNTKANKIKNSAGYSQTPKDSIVTTLTVIKLLQPIIKDSDVRIRLGAAEALLMSKAYEASTINAIDSYLKDAIKNKLAALKAFDSDYSMAESDLLESMLNVLDNKNNPDNPSKLFRYATYVKSSNKQLPRSVRASKTDYLKSIDEGVKQLNVKTTTDKKVKSKVPAKKAPAKSRQPRKPTTRGVRSKLIKTTLQKQQERIKRIRSARDKLKLFNSLDTHIPLKAPLAAASIPADIQAALASATE